MNIIKTFSLITLLACMQNSCGVAGTYRTDTFIGNFTVDRIDDKNDSILIVFMQSPRLFFLNKSERKFNVYFSLLKESQDKGIPLRILVRGNSNKIAKVLKCSSH